MHAELTSPLTGGVMTIDTQGDGNGAIVAVNGTPGTGTVELDLELPFDDPASADLYAEGLRASLIAGGLQEG